MLPDVLLTAALLGCLVAIYVLAVAFIAAVMDER